MIAVNSNTATAENIFNPDEFYQYYSDGFDNDLTTSTFTITFDETTSVSRIILDTVNFKEFRIFYNGATASTLALTSGATTASYWTSNSETSMYLQFTTIQASTITINAKKTMTANQEKVLGELVLSDTYYTLTHIPDARGYKPSKNPKQIVHKLSDGGTRIHTVRSKKSANISLDYISETIRDSLEVVYNLQTSFIFVPFGTATGWDAFYFDSVWEGAFDFYEVSDNAVAAGYSGSLKLRET